MSVLALGAAPPLPLALAALFPLQGCLTNKKTQLSRTLPKAYA